MKCKVAQRRVTGTEFVQPFPASREEPEIGGWTSQDQNKLPWAVSLFQQ